MSEIVKAGYSFFLSDMFDNHIRQLATPTKVAFISGAAVGFVAGYLTCDFRGQLRDKLLELRSQTRRPAITFQPLKGTFEQKKTEILHDLTNIFTNGNGRFSRLRHYVGCTDEFAENDLESIMSNVSSGLMTDYKQEFGIANFFAKVVKFIKTEQNIEESTSIMELEKKVNDLTRLCFDADILIINADDDMELATRIEEDVKGWNISVDIESEAAIGRSIFSSIGDAFKRYLFVFVIVTENLAGDQIQRFVSEGHLRQSVLDNRNRFIPVKNYGQEHDDAVFGILTSWTYGTERSKENLDYLVHRATGIVFNSTNEQ